MTGYGHGPVPFKYVPDYWRYPEPQPDMEPFVGPAEREGLLLPAAGTIREAVRAPVIGVGGLTPEKAERALADGRADLVALGRALWADPDLPAKLEAGRVDEIRPCTRCATCEVSPRKCRVNAALGGVGEYVLQPAQRPRRVVVVGGGPAGMEAARVAATRGHAVTLYEKERSLGGMLPLAVTVKGTETEDILGYLDYLERQLEILDIDVRLGVAATPDELRRESPDVVVVAVGGADWDAHRSRDGCLVAEVHLWGAFPRLARLRTVDKVLGHRVLAGGPSGPARSGRCSGCVILARRKHRCTEHGE